MFSLLIGQECLGWTNKSKQEQEGAVFWDTQENGEFRFISKLVASL